MLENFLKEVKTVTVRSKNWKVQKLRICKGISEEIIEGTSTGISKENL